MFILYYFLICFSLVGYGLLFSKILRLDFQNYGFLGLLGITFSITISYLINDRNIYELFKSNFDLKPFFPDKLVYCGIDKIKLNKNKKYDLNQIKEYHIKYHENPKLFTYNNNIYVNSNTLKKCIEIESLLKSHLLCYNSNNETLDDNENNYLNNWDAEKYRKNL